MARIRSIKPQWLSDEKIGQLTDSERVLTIGLMIMADDHGRGKANPALVRSTVWPYGDPPEGLGKITERLQRLSDIGFIRLYESKGQHYYEICKWAKHQRISHPGKPIEPPPPETLRNPPETLRKIPETLGTDKERERERERERVKHGVSAPAPAPARNLISTPSQPTPATVWQIWEEVAGRPCGDMSYHLQHLRSILDSCYRADGDTETVIRRAVESIWSAARRRGKTPEPRYLAADIAQHISGPVAQEPRHPTPEEVAEEDAAIAARAAARVQAWHDAGKPPLDQFVWPIPTPSDGVEGAKNKKTGKRTRKKKEGEETPISSDRGNASGCAT